MDSDSIRKKFMDDNAEFLLDEFSKVLRGDKDGFSCKSNVNLGRALSMLETVILSADDKSKIEANSIAEIIEGVKKGKITPSLADKMIDLLKSKSEIEETEQSILLQSKLLKLIGDDDDY